MSDIRLIQISDLHIANLNYRHTLYPLVRNVRRTTPYNRRILGHVAELVHAVSEEIDALLLTGDIADSGWPTDLELARTFIDGRVTSTWQARRMLDYQTLRNDRVKQCLLPGNHDKFESPASRTPAQKPRFDVIFQDYWDSGSRVRVEKLHTKDAKLGLVLIDCSLIRAGDAEGRGNHVGQGKVYEDEILEPVIRKTKELRNDGFPVVWATHFPPCYSACPGSLRLVDGERLANAAVDCKVPYILSGHLHVFDVYEVKPGVIVHCAGTASCYDPQRSEKEDTTVHLLTISIAENEIVDVSEACLRWNEEQRRFKADTIGPRHASRVTPA